ncbi:MAG: hypothetical protein SO434_05010 [Eubacteriales bacterium]|nr:hypothetical protein [Eubacteriales bacterium]
MKKRTIEKRIRIYDESVWELIDKLLASNEFKGNFNEVICQALKIGVPRLYEMTFDPQGYYRRLKDETKDKTDEEKMLRDVSYTIDDLTVQVGIVKYLATVLYNVAKMELDGKTGTSEMMDNGMLASLPEKLQEIEKIMTDNTKKRKNR